MDGIKIPDLSAWAMVELLTVEEASLLWGGIDPTFCKTVDDAEKTFPREQYQRAYITRKAIISGICAGSLPANEIYVWNEDPNCPYDAVPHHEKRLPNMADVYTAKTTINTNALISWAEKKKVYTMRQVLGQKYERPSQPIIERVKEENITDVVMLGLSYSPKHENPPLEVLQDISKEVWDQINKGDKPPKQLIIHDLIKQKYKQRTGVEPTANTIKQIDSIARPPCFKNQGGKQND